MTRAAAIAAATDRFDDGRFTADLAALVAIPSTSQDPAFATALDDYLSAMIPRLHALGFVTDVLPNPVPGGPPFLWAERTEGPDLPMVLSYGHGDTVRGQDAQWRAGLAPWTLTEEGDRLYGRGSADNKGQHLVNLTALASVLQVRGRLGFNIRLILEMGEEMGSPGLGDIARIYRDRMVADVLIASDGPRLQPDVPTLFMGSRGGLNFTLRVDLREGAHHSGNWGGLLADPAIILAHALATITDARGELLIPDWRPTSLTPEVRAALADLPIEDPTGPAIDPDWGAVALTPAERAFGWYSFAVLAMTAGVPEAPVNAIAGSARATCQLRFVVGTDPEAILPALRRHLDAQGFPQVRIEAEPRPYFPATRLNPNHPWARFVAASLERTAGVAPHVLPNLAGSLPNDVFAESLGLPTVWVPHSYRAC